MLFWYFRHAQMIFEKTALNLVSIHPYQSLTIWTSSLVLDWETILFPSILSSSGTWSLSSSSIFVFEVLQTIPFLFSQSGFSSIVLVALSFTTSTVSAVTNRLHRIWGPRLQNSLTCSPYIIEVNDRSKLESFTLIFKNSFGSLQNGCLGDSFRFRPSSF